MASDMARKPVGRKREKRLAGVGECVGFSIDDVEPVGALGEIAIASMLGESPYSSLVTVGDLGVAFSVFVN